ncbi:uncharacterized protein FOMMEDRAFT_155289 [Fomitiporia mediterranea MF3/22]|uniref:uncharacterized protein n=1 Tax=Fomitiporia mediterranea (strain MF3/22) TaxID=694068 RepID=UPI00044081B0|nr:uncharacterized protein FOMMEDRAFT_155289 [Fomitiporia mediterranea MF3/22]EJD04169.1 hypothetical protein FOMMEDRAFT_155289 [Fomitiporia mediterranea MF3/22]
MSDLAKEGSGTTDVTNDDFTFGQRLGIVFITEAAFLSLFSVLGLLGYIAFSARKTQGKRRRRWSMSTPLHVYFLSMMVAELFQATGAILNLKWIERASVDSGPFCVAQGIIKQIGDVSVALCTLAIAIHTFTAIVFRWSPPNPRLLSVLVLSVIWLTVVLIIVISAATHKNNLENYWSDTQYWCWIAKPYKLQQYLLDYCFMWATAFANIILYIPMALVIKGVFTVNGRRVRYKGPGERKQITTQGSLGSSGKGVDSIAMQMLFYPLVYTLTVLPIAIVRFRAFYDEHVPFTYTVIADVLFCCSGFFNVCLYGFTRPSLIPRRESLAVSNRNINHFSFSLRSPTVDQPLSTRPSLLPPRSPMGVLPDNSEVFRFEQHSFRDYDIHSLEPSPTKTGLSPSSISSFRTHSHE